MLIRTTALLLDNDVACLDAAISRCKHIVTNTPIMLEGAEAITLQCRIMDIYLGAIVTKNKAIATLIIEPFYSSLHNRTILFVGQSY